MKARTPAAQESKPFPGFLKRFALGMLVTILLVGVTSLVKDTSTGHWLEARAYEFLQHQLPTFKGDERLPILVVDISRIPGGKDLPTSRETLSEIIKAIADQRPKAIAVDIDFSPNGSGWKVDDDPRFFDYCLSIKRETKVPVFLAVFETRAEPAKAWLGLEKYKELAAAGVVSGDDTQRLPLWLQAKDVPDKLPTLTSALATAYKPSIAEPSSWWWTRIVEGTTDNNNGTELEDEDQTRFALTLVNYSKLEQMQHETLETTKADSIAESGDRFAGRMILLGDATRFMDSFIVPGRGKPIAGVYLEACAAYTLVDPLYELNFRTRLALDLFISVMIILSIEHIRRRFVKKRAGIRFYKRQTWIICITIALVIFSCILLIRWLNIMWLDFFLVVFALMLHPSVEGSLTRFWTKVRPSKAPAR